MSKTEKPDAQASPAKKRAPDKARAVKPDGKSYVYIGPNRLTDGLKKYTVYRGFPNGVVERLKGKYPHISRLFVTMETLNTAMDTVKQKATPESLAYEEVERGE